MFSSGCAPLKPQNAIFLQTTFFLRTKQALRGFWNVISRIHADLIFAFNVHLSIIQTTPPCLSTNSCRFPHWTPQHGSCSYEALQYSYSAYLAEASHCYVDIASYPFTHLAVFPASYYQPFCVYTVEQTPVSHGTTKNTRREREHAVQIRIMCH